MPKKPVLVADPDPSVLERVMMLLGAGGFAVRGASTSKEAIERAHVAHPELLIINPVMPGLSGVQAASQISRDERCKVIFLTELAKDADFREVLRGLRQQGCDCSAVSIPFEDSEIIAQVHHEIGSPQPDIENAREPSNTAVQGEALPRASSPPIGDYQALLHLASTQLYDHNAFRITGLSVRSSFREISRATERLEMIAKGFGAVEVALNSFSKTPPTSEELRAALQCLKSPEQRLLHEFFWFWPLTDDGNNDPAIDAINAGETARAEKVWGELADGQQELEKLLAQIDAARSSHERKELLQPKKDLERKTAIAIHNLAILNHIRALSRAAHESSKLSVHCADPTVAWKASISNWSRLHKKHEFWDALAERIREINDPRLGIETAEMIWRSLPLALLLLNAEIAMAAAEAGDFEQASIQKQLIDHSGFEITYCRDAFRRKLAPLKQELERLCDSTREQALKTPENALDIVRQFFQAKKKYLQTFNYLLGLGDPLRDSSHDLVADSARACLVAYLNKTENWEAGLPLFEECLALANSNSLRSRLEEDYETLTRNVAGQRAARRTQATAASPRQSVAPRQSSPGKPPIPVSTTGLTPAGRKAVFGLVALFVVFIIVAVANSNNSSSTSPVQSAPATTFTNPSTDSATSPDAQPSPVTSTSAPPANEESPSVPQTGEHVPNTEESQLKAEIEDNQSRLRQFEAELSDDKSRIDELSSQIDASEARLQQMKRDHDLGEDVDADSYETVRRQHNSDVDTHNQLVQEYNSTLRAYKSLLSTTNEQIDSYNALLRSQ